MLDLLDAKLTACATTGLCLLSQVTPAGEDWFTFVKSGGPLGVLVVVVWLFLKHWEKRDEMTHRWQTEQNSAWREHDAQQTRQYIAAFESLRLEVVSLKQQGKE